MAKSVTLCLFYTFLHKSSEVKQMHTALSSSQALRKYGKDFLQCVWKWIQGQRRGCWVMKIAKEWAVIERGAVWRWWRCPSHRCAQHCRKQPSAYFLTRKLEKSWGINCSMLGKDPGKLSVYSYPVLIFFPSYLFLSPIGDRRSFILLFMFLGCNAAVCILTKPSPLCCHGNGGRGKEERKIYALSCQLSALAVSDLGDCTVRAAFSWSVTCALVLTINKKCISIHERSSFLSDLLISKLQKRAEFPAKVWVLLLVPSFLYVVNTPSASCQVQLLCEPLLTVTACLYIW